MAPGRSCSGSRGPQAERKPQPEQLNTTFSLLDPNLPGEFIYQANWLTFEIGGQRVGLSPSRVYDVETGRFLQRDLLLNAQAIVRSVGTRGLAVFGTTSFAYRIAVAAHRGNLFWPTDITSQPLLMVDPLGLKMELAEKADKRAQKQAEAGLQGILDDLCENQFQVKDGKVSVKNKKFCECDPKTGKRPSESHKYAESCTCLCEVVTARDYTATIRYRHGAGSLTLAESWRAVSVREFGKPRPKVDYSKLAGVAGSGKGTSVEVQIQDPKETLSYYRYRFNLPMAGEVVVLIPVEEWQLFAWEVCGNARAFMLGKLKAGKETEAGKIALHHEKTYSVPVLQRIETEHGVLPMPSMEDVIDRWLHPPRFILPGAHPWGGES